MTKPQVDQKSLIAGIVLLSFATLAYFPIADLFYYGGGWPFLQIIFIIIYWQGVRRIRRSGISRRLKWIICLTPVLLFLAVAIAIDAYYALNLDD